MRSASLVIAAAFGALAGAAASYYAMQPAVHVPTLASPPTTETAQEPGADAGPNAVRRDPATHGGVTAERAELYRVAAAANARTLERLVQAAGAEPPSDARTFALGVLLARYAELDPDAAVAAAQNFAVEIRAPLYAAWATRDAASALQALSEIENTEVARAVALTMWPALGGDERALRQVSAAVPFGAESGVYAAAITTRAATDPAGAFAQALALTDFATRGQALEGIVQHWVKVDPNAALAAADEIKEPTLRQSFIAQVGRAWARLDPDAALAYLAASDRSRLDDYAALGNQIAQVRPREVLALGTSFATPSPAFGDPVRMMAIQVLVNEDPARALLEVESLPAGPQRDGMIAVVARGYGMRDPDAALEWARRSGESNRIVGVLQGIAQRDPERAFDAAVALDSPGLRMQAVQSIVMNAARGMVGTRSADLADRVLALPDAELRGNSLRMFLSVWSSVAPQDAVEWLAAHAVPELNGSYRQVAAQLARADPARAADTTARLPTQSRAEWIAGVADGYAQRDPEGAAAWLAQYRGDPAYDTAVASVAMGLARTDPPAAARLLATADRRSTAGNAAPSVAAAWAQRDPLAAAAWAEGYDENAAGPTTVPSVATIWARTDRPAARAWTLRLPNGQGRDAALGALLAGTPEPDVALLDAFSNPQMRDQAVMNAAMQLANRDRGAAERWIDGYMANPTMREQAKRMLERMPPGMPFYNQNVFPGAFGVVDATTGIQQGVNIAPAIRSAR